ncbi:MAG: PAS domain-containing protein, partial [Candidatus Latescibacterota bacterium]
MLDSSGVTEVEAAVAAGNSAAVLSILERQQKALDNELRKRESEFRILAHNSPDGILRLDHDFKITYSNPAAAGMMGSSGKELLGKTPLDFSMPMHIVFMWQAGVERAFASGQKESFKYEFDDLRIVHYLQITIVPELGSDEQVESVLAITRDISEQKKTGVTLRETEERFRLALESSPVTVFAQDGNLRYTWLCSSHPDWTIQKFFGRTDSDMFSDTEANHMTALKRQVLETGQPVRGEFEVTNSSGTVWLDATVVPLRNNEGQIIGVIGAALDITDRKQAEEERERLLEKEVHHSAEMSAILDSLPVGLSITDAGGRVVRMNAFAERLLGCSTEVISGDIPERLRKFRITKPDGAAFRRTESPTFRALHGEAVFSVIQALHRPEGALWLSVNASPFHAADGRLLGAVTTFEDITARMRAEKALHAACEHIQAQSDELEIQAGELQAANEELCAQAEELRAQSDELYLLNEELRKKNESVSENEERYRAISQLTSDFAFSFRISPEGQSTL